LSSVRTKHLKLVVGAAGAAALTVGAIAAPALASPHDLTYTCTGTPADLGPIASTLDPGAIPAAMTAGQSVKRNMSVVVHLSQAQTGLAQALGTSVKGGITSKGPLAFNLKIPATPIPQEPGATMDATASGTGTITANKAGSLKVNARTIAANLTISGGAAPITATQSCTPPTDGSQTLGTVTVAKDASKTTTRASYNARKDVATGTAKVQGAKFGLAGTGKVKFTLKKGTKTIKSITATLTKGSASAPFKNVKAKGNYSISTSFAGDANLKGSSGKDTFTVR
jgi:hypothetical protein